MTLRDVSCFFEAILTCDVRVCVLFVVSLSAIDVPAVLSPSGVSWESWLSDGPLVRRFPTVAGGDFANASNAVDGVQIMESVITWDSMLSAASGQMEAMGIILRDAPPPVIPVAGWTLSSIEIELMDRDSTHPEDSAEDTVVIYSIHVTGQLNFDCEWSTSLLLRFGSFGGLCCVPLCLFRPSELRVERYLRAGWRGRDS